MYRWMHVVGTVLLSGGLVACAHNKEMASTSSNAALAQYNNLESGQEGVCCVEEEDLSKRQPVAGHEDLSLQNTQGMKLKTEGQYTKPVGQFRDQGGRFFQPEGIYGKTGTYGVEGTENIKGTYGTWTRDEGKFRSAERVFVTPEGTYVRPFGGQPIVKGPGQLTENDLRQPVAGREIDLSKNGALLLSDDQGRAWVVSNPGFVKNVEQKLSAAGFDPGRIDGVADSQLSSAILKFQQKSGIRATGTLDRATVKALGLDFDQLRQSVMESRQQLQQQPMQQ